MSLFADKRSNGLKRVLYSSLESELDSYKVHDHPIVCATIDQVNFLRAKDAILARNALIVADTLKGRQVRFVGDSADVRVLKHYLYGEGELDDSYYNYSLLGSRLGINLTGREEENSTEEDWFSSDVPLSYPSGKILFRCFKWFDPQIDNIQARYILVSLVVVLAFVQENLGSISSEALQGRNSVETIVNTFWELQRQKNVLQSFDQFFHTGFENYYLEESQRFDLDFAKIKLWLQRIRLIQMFLMGQFSGDQVIIFDRPSEDLYPVLAENVCYWLKDFSIMFSKVSAHKYSNGEREVEAKVSGSPLTVYEFRYLNTFLYFN